MHRVIVTQDQGRGYMTLKNLISMKCQGERVEGFVVHQVRSKIDRKTLQEGSSQEKARSMPVR